MIVQKSVSCVSQSLPWTVLRWRNSKTGCSGKAFVRMSLHDAAAAVLYALDQVTDDGRNAYGEKFALGLSVCGKLVLSVRFHGHDSTAKLLLWVATCPDILRKVDEAGYREPRALRGDS